MGVVYEVFDRERRQPVALKKLLRYDPAALYLFKQEFRTLADVRHTNLVHLYELVVGDGDTAFFTMELVRGVDFLQYARSVIPKVASSPLETVVSLKPGRPDRETVRPPGADARNGKTPILSRSAADVDRLRPALRQLVEGIHALHLAGKLHRDVKPSNVLVTAEGRVVLLDFGVATELRGRAGEAAGGGGEVVGTARYMAPEQAGDEARTPASDWYSVGVMLYEALVGRAPFVGSTVDVLTMKSLMDATPAGRCRRRRPLGPRRPVPRALASGSRDAPRGRRDSSAPRRHEELGAPATTGGPRDGRRVHRPGGGARDVASGLRCDSLGSLRDGSRRRRLGHGQVHSRSSLPRRHCHARRGRHPARPRLRARGGPLQGGRHADRLAEPSPPPSDGRRRAAVSARGCLADRAPLPGPRTRAGLRRPGRAIDRRPAGRTPSRVRGVAPVARRSRAPAAARPLRRRRPVG